MSQPWREISCVIIAVVVCVFVRVVDAEEDEARYVICSPWFSRLKETCIADSRFYDTYCCYTWDGTACCKRWKQWVIMLVTGLAVVAVVGVVMAFIACCCGWCCFSKDKPREEEKEQIIIQEFPAPRRIVYNTNEQIFNGSQGPPRTMPSAPPPFMARPPPYREY